MRFLAFGLKLLWCVYHAAWKGGEWLTDNPGALVGYALKIGIFANIPIVPGLLLGGPVGVPPSNGDSFLTAAMAWFIAGPITDTIILADITALMVIFGAYLLHLCFGRNT
jgi:hypothetical protein